MSPSSTVKADSSRSSHVRFVVLAMLAVGTMINYLDRTVLGMVAPLLSKELVIGPVMMGFIFSAFSWSYVAAQIPGGLFLDRYGSKVTYFLALAAWSFFTLMHGFAFGVVSLFIFRIALGLSEAPCFPTNIRVVTTWFPKQERARATAIYTVGEYIGLAFLSPLLYWILAAYGWRALFSILGIIGLIFSGLWLRLYREPKESAANVAELKLLDEGDCSGSTSSAGTDKPFKIIRALFAHRQMWGACIGQFGGNATLVFFLNWFPTYLVTERHMGWIKLGFFATLPFVAASCGVLSAGWISDRMIQLMGSSGLGRKLPVIAGLLIASTMITANYVHSDFLVITIMSIAFFGQGMVGLGFALVADIAPKQYIGITSGVCNLAANLAGIITPIVIGFIVDRTGSFAGALVYVAGVALIGAFAYIFILGDVKRIIITSPEDHVC